MKIDSKHKNYFEKDKFENLPKWTNEQEKIKRQLTKKLKTTKQKDAEQFILMKDTVKCLNEFRKVYFVNHGIWPREQELVFEGMKIEILLKRYNYIEFNQEKNEYEFLIQKFKELEL